MPYQETVENYLRVALIRSGDSVIIMNEIFPQEIKRVEPRYKNYNRPLYR